ncbi:hypothetical protein HNP86_001077 [Methanococcus maripaludis]|uniref:Uncharacterized protein n=1 Tax=Methanococcus maripaludis TaxID=39152 RepID=A0A7J9NYY4_METMI|nr:hypothetical protein [Methanococcus maripaludis]MBA2846494.1 hypothetical protein [Methanococcus maripaludis]MBA2850946.1 hypothetical protein [Methanococcus maripaludis]
MSSVKTIALVGGILFAMAGLGSNLFTTIPIIGGIISAIGDTGANGFVVLCGFALLLMGGNVSLQRLLGVGLLLGAMAEPFVSAIVGSASSITLIGGLLEGAAQGTIVFVIQLVGLAMAYGISDGPDPRMIYRRRRSY